MNTDSISIQGVRASYRPGESVSGSVEWNCKTAPRVIIINLFWVTSGAAPRQVGMVDSCTIERPAPSGTNRFDFRLPEGPRSFEGALVSLAWAIEAIVSPSKLNAHVLFSVGAEAGPTQLCASVDAFQEED